MLDLPDVDMSVRIGGLRMKNPVATASGTFGFGREYSGFFNLAELGAVVVKGITLFPREGNPPPRVVETPAGMLNSVGLQNPGVDAFIKDELPFLRQCGTEVVVNISGDTVDEYSELARRLDEVSGVAALEVNVSCPNVKQGGMAFGANPSMAAAVTRAVRHATSLPVLVKLSPNAADISAVARAVESEGADGVSLINTLLGMAIDIERKRPVFANTFAGLSGPAVMPVALRLVWQVYEAVRIPVVGMGGISNWQDAAAYILAGASAVAIGTAGFANPMVWIDVARGLRAYTAGQGCHSLSEMVGAAHSTSDSGVVVR